MRGVSAGHWHRLYTSRHQWEAAQGQGESEGSLPCCDAHHGVDMFLRRVLLFSIPSHPLPTLLILLKDKTTWCIWLNPHWLEPTGYSAYSQNSTWELLGSGPCQAFLPHVFTSLTCFHTPVTHKHQSPQRDPMYFCWTNPASVHLLKLSSALQRPPLPSAWLISTHSLRLSSPCLVSQTSLTVPAVTGSVPVFPPRWYSQGINLSCLPLYLQHLLKCLAHSCLSRNMNSKNEWMS